MTEQREPKKRGRPKITATPRGDDTQSSVDDVIARLSVIEAAMIRQSELDSLGHRIIYDTRTGWSLNGAGFYCDPRLLNGCGIQVRLREP